MKKLVLIACCLVICLMATNANAVNSLVVESRGFNTSQTLCTLGVWITNDVGLTGLTIPLELRTTSGGAYIANTGITAANIFNVYAAGRVNNSPLGIADPGGMWPAANISRGAFDVAAANTCSGPISNSYATGANNFAASSPDAFFFASVSQGDPAFELITLEPGADGAARNQASFRFIVTTNANVGCFVIDTCCRTPANHLVGVDVDVNEVLFDFTPGVVSVGGANCSGPPPNTAPTAICQSIQVPANGSCQGVATAAQVNNGSNDAEDGTNLVLTLTPAGPYALGANPVSLIVTDQGGLADTCAATITVVDQTAPVLNCPSNIVVQCGGNVPAAYANAAALISAGGTVSDNCPNPTVALLDQVSDGLTCPNVITRRYVATDGAGNKDTCTQTITVDDTQNPVITDCPNDTVINLPNGQTSTQVLYSDASITDNCNSVNIIHSPLSNSTFNVGTTQVRLIATDLCGNADTCFFNVTVNELPPSNTPPDAVCQNVQVGTDANCQGTVTAAQVNNGSSDGQTAPGNLILALNPAGPYPLGQTQVWLRVTDEGGLKDSCQATITVVDDDNPTMTCPPQITQACDNQPSPYADLAAFLAAGGTASDNCDQSLTLSYQGQNCATGQNCDMSCTRTYRVTDDAGNFVECQQVLRIRDSIPPVLGGCPSNIGATVSAGTTDTIITFTVPGATDNCGSASVVATPASGSSFPVGQTVVEIIATDNCGNADTCSFTVIVTEEVADAPPVAICTDIKVAVTDPSNCWANANINNGSYDPDGGSVTTEQNPVGPYPLGTTLVLLTVTDNEGDTDTCSAWVTVNDTTAPSLQCPDDVFTSNDFGQCGAVVNFDPATAFDVCDENVDITYSMTSGSFFPVGVTQIEVVATDESGNADTCDIVVTVNDTEPPVAMCPGDTLHYPGDTACTAVPNFDLNGVGSTDNCGVETSVYTPAGNSTFPLGATQVMHVVTDSSGNADTCYFYVNVYDAAPPKVTCPGDIKVSAQFGQSSAVVTYQASASDCGGLFGFVCIPPSGSAFPIGQTVVKCVAEDLAGNVDSCMFTVTVNEGQLELAGPRTDIDTVSFKLSCNCDTIAIPVYCVEDPSKGGTCNYYTETTAPWLSVSPSQGQAPRNVDIIACVGGLNPGSYTGWVRFRNDPGAPTDSVFVELEVNAAPFGIDVTPDTLSFTYTGSIFNDKLCLPAQIQSLGCEELCWQFIGQSGDWIWVDPTSGQTPDEVEICVTPCSLAAGTYYQTLQFCACQAKGDEEDIPVAICDFLVVKLTVVDPPVLVVEPTKLQFAIDCEKKALPIPVEISNSGGGDLYWNAWTNANWLIIEPDNGEALDTFYVSIIPDSIPCPEVCDTLLDSICVYGNKGCALNSPQWVTVELIICPPDTSVCDSICGYVYDCNCDFKSNCGLDGAMVELWSSYPDGTILDTVTADWGHFCFDVEPNTDYDVRIWKKGYCTDVFEDLSCEDGFAELCLKPFDFVLPETPIFHDFYSQNATFEGNLILPGDVIFACDSNDNIIGVAYVEKPGEYLIHVLGNVPKDVDTVDEGADPGEIVCLILNCDCRVYVNEGFVNFGSTLFDAAWDCRPTGICCELCPGWNMFSYNVYLNDYSRENVLATIDLNYDAVRSGYCDEPTSPHLESWFANRPINDLTDVNPWHGYDIHMTAADTLCLEGQIIPAETPIYLCEGWNYVPYFPMEPTSMEHALESLAGNYTNVFNLWCDNFDSYNATRPINDLYCMYPCRGYWIKVNRDDTLIYPTDGYECSDAAPKLTPSYSSGQLKGSPVVADFWSNSGLNAGDIVEVYSESGMLIGEAQAGENGQFLLHVFGDVPSTSAVEGAQDGEELTFRVNGLAASVEGNTRFSDRENSHITLHMSGANPIPDEYALLQNYPNPFNAGTVIPFTMKDASDWTLTVYNIMGQTVQTFAGYDAPGTVRVNWNGLDHNGSTVPSGVYFYRVTTATWSATKKMTLLK